MGWVIEYDCGKSIYIWMMFLFYIIEEAIMINIYKKNLPPQYKKNIFLCIV